MIILYVDRFSAGTSLPLHASLALTHLFPAYGSASPVAS